MQPTDKRVPTVEQWEALADKINEGGGGVQPDYDEYDSTAQDYIKNRKFYDNSPYFYAQNQSRYSSFSDSIFTELPTVNSISFDPTNANDYFSRALGIDTANFEASGSWESTPYWQSPLTGRLFSQVVYKYSRAGVTYTETLTPRAVVADDGTRLYIYQPGFDHEVFWTTIVVYKDLFILLVNPGYVEFSGAEVFFNSIEITGRNGISATTIPTRFLPAATSTTPGVITLAQTISSVGEGLEKDSSGVASVVAGLADYDENDSTKAAYIKNRPFYETTSTEQQSIISGTIPAYFSDNQNSRSDGAWALLSDTLAQDTENRNIQLDTGALYSYVTAETITAIIGALGSNKPVTFGNIGGTWFSMDTGEEYTSYFTFVATSYSQLSNGIYALEGTVTSTRVSTPKTAVLYMGATSDICADGNDWMSTSFETPIPNGMILCANNLNYEANEGGMLPQFSPSSVWTISAEVEVSVLKQLDSKFIKVDGDTISVNSDGELEAQAGGGGGPTVVQTTGTSTTDVMSQNAVTEALASAGGIKTLTTADYPSGVELWTLASGYYVIAAGTRYKVKSADSSATASANIPVVISNSGSGYTAIEISRNIRPEIFTVMTANGTDASDDSFVLTLNNTRVIRAGDVKDVLTSTSGKNPLSANQGRVLKDLIDSIAIRGAGAPTTSTVGTVGQLYEDGTNGALYQLKSIDITVTPNTYNWEEVGGGSGPTVVQTTGTSTTDVMSQNAVTTALGNVLVNGGTTVPTSSTVGQVGTQYNCVNNGEPEIYICTAVDTSTTPNTYTWKKVGLTLQLSTTDPGEGSPLADNTLLGIYE